MSAIKRIDVEVTSSVQDLETRLKYLEANTPREILGIGSATLDVPQNAINFVDYRENWDADLLPALRLEVVPATVHGNEDAFFTFLDPFLSTHILIDHAKICVQGTPQVVILLREHVPGSSQILEGDGTWGWHARVDGYDLVVDGAKTTAFGGSDDHHDSGRTASGFPTRGNPNLLGCALPFAYTGTSPTLKAALGGSPIPKMPYGVFPDGRINQAGAQVLVTDPGTGKSIQVPVVDRGPAKNPLDPRPLDLTVAAAKFFDPAATANNFSRILDFRILNGVRLGGVNLISGIRDGFPTELVDICLEQWRTFGASNENEQPLKSQIRRYWTDLGFSFSNVGVPWSAVFISWVVKSAGASTDEFKFSTYHSVFVYWAINGLPRPAFIARSIGEYAPKIGDILHNNRSGNSYSFAHATTNEIYDSHSAVIVEIGTDELGKYAMTIGGNESNTIRKQKVRLKNTGKVVQRSSDPFISILECIKI